MSQQYEYVCGECGFVQEKNYTDTNYAISCERCDIEDVHLDTVVLSDKSQDVEVAETLRDKFAASWLTGHVANPQEMGFTDLSHAAEYAYKAADAMLKAREVKHD